MKSNSINNILLLLIQYVQDLKERKKGYLKKKSIILAKKCFSYFDFGRNLITKVNITQNYLTKAILT